MEPDVIESIGPLLVVRESRNERRNNYPSYQDVGHTKGAIPPDPLLYAVVAIIIYELTGCPCKESTVFGNEVAELDVDGQSKGSQRPLRIAVSRHKPC